jgi:hypothetical protein
MLKFSEPGLICIGAFILLGICAFINPSSISIFKDPVNITIGGYFGYISRDVMEKK